MRKHYWFAFIVALFPAAALACKCVEHTPAELLSTFDRIALVEVVALGPEFDGLSPIPNKQGHNRYIRLRVIESFAGNWSPEETIFETLQIEGYEFDCRLYNARPGNKFILFLPATESLAVWCNTHGPDPAFLEALRNGRKGA